MITINYYERAKERPEIFTQLVCKELLFLHYNCPSDDRLIGKWSQHNYILYVLKGKLAYHTPGRSWLVNGDNAVFIKKGAGIMEKFFEESLCIMTFFIPDDYLVSFIRQNKTMPRSSVSGEPVADLIIPLTVNDMMRGYFTSLIPYFSAEKIPSEDLLELKFRELLFNILANSSNADLNGYLQTLAVTGADPLQQIMEANCLFNLSLQDYAKLCNRSLSSFKRDFQTVYKSNPGNWLLGKKLNYAHHLVVGSEKSISDIAFESGFENSTHFSRVFKKRFGQSPLPYRNLSFVS